MSRIPSIGSAIVLGTMLIALSLFSACSDDGDPQIPVDGDEDVVTEVEVEVWEPTSCSSNDDCEGFLICHSEVQGGICLESCDFGLPEAQGDAYCQLFADDYLCQPVLGQVCAPPCQSDSDCDDIVEGTRCGDDGLCLPPAECSSNDDCTLGRLCMPDVNGGTCMVDCRLTLDGKTGDELCQTEGDEYVCFPEADGYCGLPCEDNSPCTVFHPLYVCGNDQRCQKPSGLQCNLNSDCSDGEACHRSTDETTAICSASCLTGDFSLTGDEYCDFILEGTVCQEVFGGSCRNPCSSTPECQAIDSNLECSNDGHCIPMEVDKSCNEDNDCAQGFVCHHDWHVKDDTLGTCGSNCELGGPVGENGAMLSGNEYCGALFEDGKCNEYFGYRCQAPCADDNACAFYSLDAVCLNSNVCRSLATIESCTESDECPLSETCHTYVGAGTCAADCGVGDEGGIDNGFCNALSPGFICQEQLGNVCAPRCVEDAFCQIEDATYTCRGDGECISPDNPTVCTTNDDCDEGDICHTEVPGGACLPSCTTGLNEVTGDSFCSLYTTEGALCYGNEGGLCIPKCANDDFCRQVDPAWTCDVALGLCSKPYVPQSCSSDTECPWGMACHSLGAGMGECGNLCESNADCPAIETNLRYCSSNGACRLFDERTSPCTEDSDCDVGLVCHLKDESGICAPSCALQTDCFASLGTNFICDDDGYCQRGTAASWGSCSVPADCAFGFSCVEEICQPDNPQQYAPCNEDADCAAGYVCNDILRLKTCQPACEEDLDCNAFAPGLLCAQDQHCVSQGTVNTPCQDNEDCSYGEACHDLSEGKECGQPCAGDAECLAFGAGLLCYNDGQCRAEDVSNQACASDVDCLPGKVCHIDAAGGVCADACAADADCETLESGFVCNGAFRCVAGGSLVEPCTVDTDCAAGNVCMLAVDGGSCKPPCSTDTECRQYADNFVCRSDARCVAPESLSDPCQTDMDCTLGLTCHSLFEQCLQPCEDDSYCNVTFGPGFMCNEAGQCIANSGVGTCAGDSDCPMGQVCNADQHVCWAPCAENDDCLRFGTDFCNSLGQCINDPLTSDCTVDADCPVGHLCMKDTTFNRVACYPACNDSAICNEISANFECRADHRCHLNEAVSGCDDVSDCYPGMVCHPEFETGINDATGVCMPPCTSESECNQISPDLYCNGDQFCVYEN